LSRHDIQSPEYITMKKIQLCLAYTTVALATVLAITGHLAVAVLFLTLIACALNQPKARLCAVTLSVPELLSEALGAFKVSTPELFGPEGFARDFSSDSAVLGDKITAHIAHVPAVGNYDANNGGFKNASQSVTGLIEDVSVTLNRLKVVTINTTGLTALASKDPAVFKAAIGNAGHALGKHVVDTVIAQALANVSTQLQVALPLVNLDYFDGDVRNACNGLKFSRDNRFCFLNTALAGALGADDRTRSKLFVGQLNGESGFRRWQNLAGFSWVREYPDLPVGMAGLAGDPRLACVAVRRIKDVSNVASQLGTPELMRFDSARDPESGLELTAASWQEPGTGDAYVSFGILFGTHVGNNGGAPLSGTDSAGLILSVI
jgi:hypothetical protein